MTKLQCRWSHVSVVGSIKKLMTISTTKLTDNSFNIIVKINGVGSEEEQTLVDVVNSNNATSELKVSIDRYSL